MRAVVEQCNDLTRRWVREAPLSGGGVLSGVGVWPLLAALQAGADGAAKDELARATGVDAAEATAVVAEVVDLVRATPCLRLALGAWARPPVSLRETWTAALPSVSTDALPAEDSDAQAVLDRWARDATGGLIPTFPLAVDPSTLFVLASALAADARWEQPFEPSVSRWEAVDGWFEWLFSRHGDLDLAAVIEGEGRRVGRFVSRTTDDLDVHLVAGSADEPPAGVLSLAIAALGGAATVRPGSTLGLGEQAGGLVVEEVASMDPTPVLRVGLPAFDVRSDHDLLEHRSLFGLESATDDATGHFDGISPFPLAVQAGAQSVLASFTAEGFRAAAVTAFAMRAGAAMPAEKARQVRLSFDRPFGFLAVQRSTGLVLVAGWVSGPDQLQPAE